MGNQSLYYFIQCFSTSKSVTIALKKGLIIPVTYGTMGLLDNVQ